MNFCLTVCNWLSLVTVYDDKTIDLFHFYLQVSENSKESSLLPNISHARLKFHHPSTSPCI